MISDEIMAYFGENHRKAQLIYQTMDTSGATPISLTADSCSLNENRCHIATPAPSTPFPYSPLSPYGTINPFSYMSRYSNAGAAAHLQSAYSSPLASSLPPGLAYPADIFHYNPYSALTPTSPLTPSSFWSLTAQQSYHQLNGITFGPSGPVSYNANAHLFNIFSPNSLSPMSPSPDLHSPSLYPRVSSMPSPYASSPGLSSAFMSPSSMPLLLSPSLSSSVDRPPTYFSDNTTTPSTTPSMTPSIKCEPIEHNCGSHHTSQLMASNFNDNCFDKNNSIERHTERERVDKSIERHSKKQNISNSSKQSLKVPTDNEIKQQSHQKTITTTITQSVPHIKTKEKHSARVEPLIRGMDNNIDCLVINGSRDVTSDLNDKIVDNNDNKHKNCEELTISSAKQTNIEESPDKHRIRDNNHLIKDNKDLKSMNAKVKRELIECDISLPSNTIESVPNCCDHTIDSNGSAVTTNNISESGSKTLCQSLVDRKVDDNSQMADKNLIIDDNSNSNSNDKTDLVIVTDCHNNNNNDNNINQQKTQLSDETNKPKDAKRESQLKQLQSYRKESHRLNGNKPAVNPIQSQPINGIESNAAISIVLPKPNDQINGQHIKPLKLVNQSSNLANQSQTPLVSVSLPNTTLGSTITTAVTTTTNSVPVTNAVQNRTHSKAQNVITCHTKPVFKITANNSSPNQTQHQKQSISLPKTVAICPNQSIGPKLPPNTSNNATKQLPKKPRISQKNSSKIPIGIAIAQQRTSPKTKSPNDSANNTSQPLKPILPTLSLPVMANSPILITDSPPAGTSLWIKPTTNSTLTNSNSIQNSSQFSLTGDYQLARDSLTGHLYLIRNSSSLPSTPTTTPKPQTMIPPLTIKSNDLQSKSSPSAIITLPVGAAQTQQFFANLGPTQTSTLILDTTNSTPLVQIATTAPVTPLNTNNSVKCLQNLDTKLISNVNKSTEIINSSVNVERGCQASISDDELTCDNMKTTATQVDMDSIHSSEEDDDNEGKRHKLRLFSERKLKNCEKGSSIDEEEDSRDSVHLQIVDELAADEPPQLPVKSAPVMQFIDHHGLDLLVDSIEEFAAREETAPPTSELTVNGLQLLSTLAEQRSREERSGSDSGSLRRHSADSNTVTNGLNYNNQTNSEFNALKRRQRSESCFITNPNKFDENEELFSDIKKLKTSGCQTDDRRINRFDNSFLNLRRSERIFINDSVVSNVKDVNNDVKDKDKDLLFSTDFKKKDDSESKSKIVSNDTSVVSDKNISNSEQSSKVRVKDQYVFTGTKCDDFVANLNKISVINNKTKLNDSSVFCDNYKTNNQKIGSDLANNTPIDKTDGQKSIEIKHKKKNKLLLASSSVCGTPSDSINTEKKVKKRKKRPTEDDYNKKKLKSDYDKQIDDSIESIIKRVAQIDEHIDETVLENQSKETNLMSEELTKTESKDSDEQKDFNKKKRPLVKTSSFELYDQKRMKLLDETIDEIIAKQSVQIESESEEKPIEPMDETEIKVLKMAEPEELKPTPIEPPKPVSSLPEIAAEECKQTEAEVTAPKLKPFIKQLSTCSSSSLSSSISSVSESCQSLNRSLNLKLTENDLDLKLNVIMLVDGLLFVGEICPIQAPDIYGIVLHGERQHRPIIYSQEEMLKEAIREVKPSLEDLEEGQRVCAYWSTQYRHLYPGFVRSSSPHPNLVFVEFDDGDNGRISIDDIRLLPQDYPQMKINADPLKNLERRRRMSSCGNKDKNSKQQSDNSGDNKIDDKKICSEEMSKTIKNKTNTEEVKTNSVKDPKKAKNSKIKSNKSCNTTSDKINSTQETSNDKLASKSDPLKKKKKKHNKDDRHHRHHHNHKHRNHHCRHHRKSKKHKKTKEENSSPVSSGSNSLQNDLSDKTDEKTDKSCENNSKPIKLVATKSTPKESKEIEERERDSIDAQNDSVDYQNDNKNAINGSNSFENKDNNKSPLKTFIKKTPKQRALDRLQTNLSETFLTISSPVRKRYTNDSNNTNSSSGGPLTPKKRERMPSAEKSKIAAFLPDRQLWHWSGKYIKRTGNKGSRTRKVYYREIERGRERIKVDDCAVFLSTGRPHLPYIGRIDSMWQTGSGTMIVKVRWFYHPEETKGQPVPLLDKRGALFESSHFDVNDVQTISHKCQVISWSEYQDRRRDNPLMVSDDPPNVYYLAGQYDALGGQIEMDPSVPLKDIKSKELITEKTTTTEKTT